MCNCGQAKKIIDARGASKPRAITVGHEVAGYVNGKPQYRQVTYDSDGQSRPVAASR